MPNASKEPAKRDLKFDILYFIAVLFAVLLIREFLAGERHVQTIPYSEFKTLVDKSEVKDLVVGPTRVTGTYVNPADKNVEHFATVRVEPQFADELIRRGIRFSGQPEPGVLSNFMSWLLPTVGFVLIWMFLLKPMTSGQGGLLG